MCVIDNSGSSTYGLNGLCLGGEHPAYAPSEYGLPLPFLIPLQGTIVSV